MQKIFQDLGNDLAAYIQATVKEQLAVQQADGEQEELLTIQEVAQLFSVSKVTIHAWMKKGILPFLKINTRTRFKKSEILAILSKKKTGDTATNLPTKDDAIPEGI